MSDGRYLKDRAMLYLLFFGAVVVISAVILLLPYETVYVRDEAYLDMFLVTIVVCVAVFFLGTLYNVLIWMHGKGLEGAPEGRLLRLLVKAARFVLSRRFRRIASVFVKDALYLSKLKDRSVTRWAMHLLILGGFGAMFVLDLVVTFSLDFLKYPPMIDDTGWAKLWLRDFGFDFVGFLLLLGLLIAAGRRFIFRPKMVRTELPDATSILLLLAVVLGGFILEGMGIAGEIPGHQHDNAYSFLGYAFSLVMPSDIGQYYDQAWLLHGVMSALLIAYIPFSKLFHMIATPIAIEADKMLPEVRMA
ncbi:MAG: respiratory nitrate reductase subunit gamma [Thermoplasmatota archaeon]